MLEAMEAEFPPHVPRNASMTHPLQGACYNNGFLYGSSNWASSGGYRLPFSTDYNLVAPCITASDYGRVNYYNDIGSSAW